MRQLVIFLLVYVGQIFHCVAQQINCSIIQMKSGTFYIIPDFCATDCFYSWSNRSNVAFANHGGKINNSVAASNKTFLHTYKCHEWMKYTRSCISEGDVKTVICVANCTVIESSVPSAANHWIILVAVCVLLLLIPFLCCFFKNKPCSWRKCPYNAVNERNNQANEEDVEAQRH